MDHYPEIYGSWSLPELPANDDNLCGPTPSQQRLTMDQALWQSGGLEQFEGILQPEANEDLHLSLNSCGLETLSATHFPVLDQDWSFILATYYHTDGTPAPEPAFMNSTSSFWGHPGTYLPSNGTPEALTPSSDGIFGMFLASPATCLATSTTSESFPCPAFEGSNLLSESAPLEHTTFPTPAPNGGGVMPSKSQPRRRAPRHQQDGYPRLPRRVWRNYVRPEKCPHCGTGFPFQADLTKHIHVHHSADQGVPRPVYTCGVAACRKTYGRSDHLYRHGIKKHDWPPGGQRQIRRGVSRSKDAR